MAERGIALLTDAGLRESIGRRAAQIVRERYCTELVVPQYEAEYRIRAGASLTRRAGRPSAGASG